VAKNVSEREVTRRQLIAGGAGAIGGLVVGGLAGSQLATKSTSSGGTGGSKGSIKVVGVYPLSGSIASDGKEMANGVRMAVDEINARGGLVGYKLNYVEIDDKDSNTDQTTSPPAPSSTSSPTPAPSTTTSTLRSPGSSATRATRASTGASSSATPPRSGTGGASPSGSTARSTRACST
jgi:hypothetical protein